MMRNSIIFVLLVLTYTVLADQGGIPHNPMHPVNPGEQPGMQVPSQPSETNVQSTSQNVSNQSIQSSQVAATNKANTQAAVSSIATSASTNQTAIALRGLLLNPHDSYDLWSTTTGTFDKTQNIASISSGFDYRITPNWIVGLLGNWVMGKHIDGSAMNGGVYTAATLCRFYLIASEVMNREPETYLSYAQLGYTVRCGNLLASPFYSVIYGSKHDTIQNQVGGWINYTIGRFSPEVQFTYENNCKQAIPAARDLIWVGAILNYKLTSNLFLNAGYNFEGNRRVKANQVSVGFKIRF